MVHAMNFKSKFRKLKIHLYLNILLGIGAFLFLLNAFIYRRGYLWIFLACGILCLAILVPSEKKRRTFAAELIKDVDGKSTPFIRFFDRYNRRLINWTFAAFYMVFTFIFSLVSLGLNSKPYEFLEKFNVNLIIFEVIVFFIVKNFDLILWFSFY